MGEHRAHQQEQIEDQIEDLELSDDSPDTISGGHDKPLLPGNSKWGPIVLKEGGTT
jgi:hypothetical protein